MNVEAVVLGSPSLIVLVASVAVEQHLTKGILRTQELCKSRDGPSWALRP